ncbi:MAG: GC-type dockerin domain-anchored protein [Phycisphaerales bacterium]
MVTLEWEARKKGFAMKRVWSVAMFVLVGCGAAHADTLVFTNAAGTGRWGDAGNWSQPRVPGLGDDVEIPAGLAPCLVDTPSQARSILAGSPVYFDAPIELAAESVFDSEVRIVAGVQGFGELRFNSVVHWRGGEMGGGGLTVVGETGVLRVEPEGQPTLARVMEVFGAIEVSSQVLRIDRPSGLVRIPDGGVMRLLDGGSVLADETADESMVISGSLECSGAGSCQVAALFLNVGRVTASCPLIVAPAPSNLSVFGDLFFGVWETNQLGSISWPAEQPVTAIEAGAVLRLSGEGSSPTLYGNLRRIDGELLVEGATPTVVVRAGASNLTTVSGRVRVTGGSRISFGTGFRCTTAARFELEPSLDQPPITALNSVFPAALLSGLLEIVPPSVPPSGCGEYLPLITSAGTFDPMEGDFIGTQTPQVTLEQPYVYTPVRLVGDVYENIAVLTSSPADWTRDGGVDGDDTIAFFADWDVGLADLTGDGSSDGDDIIAYFARWDAGC